MKIFSTKPREFVSYFDKKTWLDRWALDVYCDKDLGISLFREVKSIDAQEFFFGGVSYNAILTKEFLLGSCHTWYDGPHCAVYLGFLTISWSGRQCKKCESGDIFWTWPNEGNDGEV